MKLLFCEIENFGKLRGVKLELSDGVCGFEKPNGWGKTTLSAFLKCMFYGMKDNRSKSVEANERIKYLPWQGGTFGGAVVFSYQNRTYRLERSFGKTPSRDTFALYDAETRLPVTALGDGSNLGERLFGLDKESFCRTAYFSQDDGTFGELTGDIKSNLMRAFNAQGENAARENGLESALKRLDEAEKRLKKNRAPSKGKLDELEEKLVAVTRAKGALVVAQEEADEARARSKAADEDLAIAQEELAECDRTIGAASAKNTPQSSAEDPLYENYRQETERSKERVRQLRAFFPVDPETLDLKPLEQKTERYYALKAERENGLAASRAQAETPKKTARNPVLGVACVLLCLALLGVAVYLFRRDVLFAVFSIVASGVFAAVGACCLKGKKTVDRSPAPAVLQEVGEIDREIAALEKELSRTFSAYPFAATLDYGAALQAVRAKREEYLSELQMLDRLRGLSQRKEGGEAQRQTPQTAELQSLAERRRDLVERCARISREKLAAATLLDEKEKRVEELQCTLGEEGELLAERERLEKKLQAVRAAKEYLTQAHASLATRYLTPVSRGVQEYLRSFDGSLSVELDANGDPYVKEGGFTRETGYYSRGYRDLFGLCLRLALLDALYEKEKPFLVFDDPFVNLDGKNTQAAASLLRSVSKRYQILYFTCKTPL